MNCTDNPSPEDELDQALIDPRPVSVNDHAEFLAGLLKPDDTDDFDDLIEVDPYEPQFNRRSDKDISRTLAILDSLANKKGGAK